MRQLSLTPIMIGENAYPIKETIIGCLFHPDMKLSPRDLIQTEAFAQKIEKAESYLLLEETEYEKVKRAIETQKGWQRGDVEFVSRILNAQEVSVEVVKS